MGGSYRTGRRSSDHIDWLRELGQIYEEAHDVIQYINLRHLEIERLQAQIAAMTKDMDSLEKQLEMADAAIERWKAENEELRKALGSMLTHMGMDEDEWNKPTFDQARAALKALSNDEFARAERSDTLKAEPVGVILNKTFLPTMSMDDLRDGNVYYSPPTATALVEDFRKRVIEECMDRVFYKGQGYWQVRDAIESLPLIQGEK